MAQMTASESKIILFHHLGLGDHFICNGLVNVTSDRFAQVFLPCWRHNLVSVEVLYSDDPRIRPLPIDRLEDVYNFSSATGIPVLPVGHDFLKRTQTIWYEAFYEQLNLDPALRLKAFRLPRFIPGVADLYRKVVSGEPYVLVHCQSSTGTYPIDLGEIASDGTSLVYVRPEVSPSLLSWLDVFRCAREIHVINRSVFWLLDCMSDLSATLVYHDIRLGDPVRPGARWRVVRYGQQFP